jgi:hypothetical protein
LDGPCGDWGGTEAGVCRGGQVRRQAAEQLYAAVALVGDALPPPAPRHAAAIEALLAETAWDGPLTAARAACDALAALFLSACT